MLGTADVYYTGVRAHKTPLVNDSFPDVWGRDHPLLPNSPPSSTSGQLECIVHVVDEVVVFTDEMDAIPLRSIRDHTGWPLVGPLLKKTLTPRLR